VHSATVFYAAVLAGTGLVETCLWMYVSHGHRLVDAGLAASEIRIATVRGLVAPTVFLLSIPMALVAPYVAMVTWLLIIPLIWLLMRTRRGALENGLRAVDG
jgi:hypothetical protein